jgi:hypothetical protein
MTTATTDILEKLREEIKFIRHEKIDIINLV